GALHAAYARPTHALWGRCAPALGEGELALHAVTPRRVVRIPGFVPALRRLAQQPDEGHGADDEGERRAHDTHDRGPPVGVAAEEGDRPEDDPHERWDHPRQAEHEPHQADDPEYP